ncbi:MAG: hypothetical protein ACU0AU_13975 [Cognatishimia activa]
MKRTAIAALTGATLASQALGGVLDTDTPACFEEPSLQKIMWHLSNSQYNEMQSMLDTGECVILPTGLDYEIETNNHPGNSEIFFNNPIHGHDSWVWVPSFMLPENS